MPTDETARKKSLNGMRNIFLDEFARWLETFHFTQLNINMGFLIRPKFFAGIAHNRRFGRRRKPNIHEEL